MPKASSFFAPRSASAVSAASSADAQLKEALRISREEARVAQLSEDEALQEALRASEAEARGKELDQEEVEREQVQEAGEERGRKRQRVEGAGRDGARSIQPGPEASSSQLEAKSESKQATSSATKAMAPLFGSISRVAPPSFPEGGSELSSAPPEVINLYDGSLDMLYAKGWIVPDTRRQLFNWMLNELAWHRVTYKRPGGMTITTPRYTTTFGRDDTPAPLSTKVYPLLPKPLPRPLDELRQQAERLTGAHFNTCIVNYYADGKDSISYHSDDERFLGDKPTIASISLGSTRDFYMRRKAPAGVAVPSALPSQKMGTKGSGPSAERPTEKYKLADGDLVVMRGLSQSEWEHAIPKRAKAAGRINITFRRVMSVDGTNNFQRYNRGDGPELRWRGNRMVEGDGGL